MKFTAFIFSILMFAGIANAGSGADCEQVKADFGILETTKFDADGNVVVPEDGKGKDSEGTR